MTVVKVIFQSLGIFWVELFDKLEPEKLLFDLVAPETRINFSKEATDRVKEKPTLPQKIFT